MKLSSTFSSLLASLAVHGLVFCGGYGAFVHAADYGIQGSSASVEIYMVAALPEVTESATVPTPERESAPLLTEEKGEMPVLRAKPEPQKKLRGETEKILPAKKRNIKKSKVKGDGSSPVPGEHATTLFSAGSDEISARPGKYLNRPPQYPPLAIERAQEGLVVLGVVINPDGRPSEVRIQKSSGYALLDHAARKGISRWRFEPARLLNRPVASRLTIPVRFSLDELASR